MNIAITGIGVANPQYKQSQTKVVDLMLRHLPLTQVERRLLKTVYRGSGIDYRHSVLADFAKEDEALSFFPNDPSHPYPGTQSRMKIYKENALPLALSAIEACFAVVPEVPMGAITHLITVSCTGMYAPGLDIEIVNALGLATSTHRTTINFMGCYGAFNAMKAAHAICAANARAKVLLVSVELCTLHFQKVFSLDNLIASAIFADGAGAMLIESISGASPGLVFQDFYCDILSEGKQEMTWDIGEQGFDIRLSSYVPELIEKGIAAFVDRLLSRQACTLRAVDYYAIHPGGKKILEACEKALQLKPQANKFSYAVLKNYGNMSSATIIFVLKNILDTLGKNEHQKQLFCCAFGPGLTLESMLLSYHAV